MISFHANYVTHMPLEKKNVSGIFEKSYVNLACLTSKNLNDRKTIANTAILWKNKDQYAKEIFNCVWNEYYMDTPNDKFVYYAMTTQKRCYADLLPKFILGLALIKKRSKDFLELLYLQVNPEQKHGSENRTFKGIGTSFLNFLKMKFQNQSILVDPDENAIDFYVKNGFQIYKDTEKMIYTPPYLK